MKKCLLNKSIDIFNKTYYEILKSYDNDKIFKYEFELFYDKFIEHININESDKLFTKDEFVIFKPVSPIDALGYILDFDKLLKFNNIDATDFENISNILSETISDKISYSVYFLNDIKSLKIVTEERDDRLMFSVREMMAFNGYINFFSYLRTDENGKIVYVYQFDKITHINKILKESLKDLNNEDLIITNDKIESELYIDHREYKDYELVYALLPRVIVGDSIEDIKKINFSDIEEIERNSDILKIYFSNGDTEEISHTEWISGKEHKYWVNFPTIS